MAAPTISPINGNWHADTRGRVSLLPDKRGVVGAAPYNLIDKRELTMNAK